MKIRKMGTKMSKIVLRNIHLVNWYGFINTTIPIAKNLSLISGENECGKSTILDAIKYAYTGDTQFNKSTSGYNTGVGKRNLLSYTRCLVDASAGIYARPANKMPVVYTHIALEYYDQVNDKVFVLGVVIESAVADIRGTHWYAIDGKTINDISFVYEQDGLMKPYDAAGFQNKYKIALKMKKEGITLFMQRTGLKLPYQDVPKYQRKLRNIMAYNPAAKIQEFIKESVLEEHNVNFDKLKDAKENIEKINLSLEQIDQELKVLQDILQCYDEYDRKVMQIKVDNVKVIYQELVSHQNKCHEAEKLITKNQISCNNTNQKMEEVEKQIEETDKRYTEAKRALQEMDVTQAIEESRQTIKKYKDEVCLLEKDKAELEGFQDKIQEVIAKLQTIPVAIHNIEIATKLTARNFDVAEKKIFLDELKDSITDCRDMLLRQSGLVKQSLSEVQKECNEQSAIIAICNKNRADYSHVQEQMGLIAEINDRFKRSHINEEAKMACEYVVEIKDEKWRDAIEAFLGIHRYAIIVSPAYFDIANQVIDHSRHKYVELVNTKRLMKYQARCEEDSVYHFLKIQNAVAVAYFTFWLGRIHAVPIALVAAYDNAMSCEGKLSRNMAITYINQKRIKSYCLGSKAIELNKAVAEGKLHELEEKEKGLLATQKKLFEHTDFFRESLSYFKEYNLDVHDMLMKRIGMLNEEKKRYQDLLEAQKDNAEFMTLAHRVEELDKLLNSRKAERDQHQRTISNLEAEAAQAKKALVEYRGIVQEKQQALAEEKTLHSSAVEVAIKEYDAYLAGTNANGGLMNLSTKSRLDRRIRELGSLIISSEQDYNNRRQDVDRLSIGLEHEAEYQERRGRIWIDDLQGMQEKLRVQTVTYEKIFKREFVLSIYETAKNARSDISDINKELRKLQFATQYQFDVNMLKDSSDYAKILRYAEYLQGTNNIADEQMSLVGLMGYDNDEVEKRENEIRNIIDRIIEKNDHGEIKRFADYRNYMSYEIIINSAEVKDGKLSKQVGYNSGAGTQIPYTLILSAALSMLYNVRVNSVRLLFIDEPFEKMSDHNIKLMLDFFVDQDFQVIFCAPPNKLESIGNECGIIIPVLKKSNENMQIGQVRFHE